MSQYNVVITFQTDNASAADEFAENLAAAMDGASTEIVMEHATMTAEDGTITDLMDVEPAAPVKQGTETPPTDEPASESLPTGKEF